MEVERKMPDATPEQRLRHWAETGESNVFFNPREVREDLKVVFADFDRARELHREEQQRSADRLRAALEEGAD